MKLTNVPVRICVLYIVYGRYVRYLHRLYRLSVKCLLLYIVDEFYVMDNVLRHKRFIFFIYIYIYCMV